MDMLCVAAEADPVGYVTVAGKPLDVPDLCRLCGETPDVVKTLLDELRYHGVFSVTRSGQIYSRRMVKEAITSSKSVENGKLGGNPTLLKDTRKSHGDNPIDKSSRTRVPEARGQNPERDSPIGERLSAKQIAEAMIEIWNHECGPTGLRIVTKLNQPRQVTCNARFKQDFASDINQWRIFVRRVIASSFLLGGNNQGFRATFDWVLCPRNSTKIIEGNYDDRATNGAADHELSFYDGPTEPPPTLEGSKIPLERAH